ncbi:MAG: hypothetical protein GX580_00240 [Candidatus Hydrogenedens sp.]|nr:hypothetical protein [Candidatus Hydrogenedens sp.]
MAAALAMPLCAAAWAGTPEVAWSAYLGGAAFDHVRAAAADRDGNLLLAGYTASAGWTANGWDTSHNGGTNDGFVVKLSPSGAHLWSTYLGGSGNDQCHGVAVDRTAMSSSRAFQTRPIGPAADGTLCMAGETTPSR